MGPLVAPIVGGLANLVGGLFGNSAAAGQASAQRAFEERMSSTSWQRGVADMRAAGINPMLSFMEGGASTPGGAMAGVPNANVLGDSVNSALSTAAQVKQIELLERQKYTEQARGFGQVLDNIKTQVNDLPFTVGGAKWSGSGEVPRGEAPGLSGLRWRLANSVMEANANSANAAASYSRAGVGQREGVSSLFNMLKPLIGSATQGFRQLGNLLPGGH